MQHWNFSYRTSSKTQRARDFPLIWKNLCGHRALVFFFLLPVSTMKYFTCKPKQRRRESFVLRKEINTSEMGKVSKNIWFNQATGCWIMALKCWTVLGLHNTALQAMTIITSLLGSELQDTCFVLMSTRIRRKRWHSGWANQLSIQISVCSSYLQYHICSTLSIFDPRAE